MTFQHVFSTHAYLQEYLTEAIIRDRQLDPGRVLVLRVRGSYRPGEETAYTVLDGSRYNARNGRNLIKHRRENRRRYDLFTAEVLDRLAPGFETYGPMYTYWYLRILADRAARYHVLEDGLGSYQTREEFRRHFELSRSRSVGKLIATVQRKIAMVPEQRSRTGDTVDLLDGVGRYFCTSRECFPEVDSHQRVVPQNIFPPRYVGEYEGATVLATSCFPEVGLMPLETYLTMLRAVIRKVGARGVARLHYKLHPQQARHEANAADYRLAIEDAARGLIEVVEISQGVSIESLAAGNGITLVTGLSTLGFHVASTGAEVLTYLDDIERIYPDSLAGISTAGLKAFRRISVPL